MHDIVMDNRVSDSCGLGPDLGKFGMYQHGAWNNKKNTKEADMWIRTRESAKQNRLKANIIITLFAIWISPIFKKKCQKHHCPQF